MVRTKKKTSREQREQFTLIELVKGHPELWDYKHQGYNNNVLLLKAWDQIGKVFGFSHNDVRLKWKSLRDMHRLHYKREVRTGQPSKWLYYKSLSFLKDYYDGVNLERKKKEEEENLRNNQDGNVNMADIIAEQNIKQEQRELEGEENTEMRLIDAQSIKEEAESDGEFERALIPQVDYEDREEQIQSFLKTLLPEIENMSNKQMRMFKTKVSELVESILDR